MSSGNVELKATISSDAGAATQSVKTYGETVKGAGAAASTTASQMKLFGDIIGETGDQAKETEDDVSGLSEHFKKLASRETAEKILSLVATFEKVGDVMTGIAENDADKFENGMDAAVRGVTGVVGLIAPEFAPVVAVLGTVITKTASWAFGMRDAAEAAKQLDDALKDHTQLMSRAEEVELAAAHDAKARSDIKLKYIDKEIKAEEDRKSAAIKAHESKATLDAIDDKLGALYHERRVNRTEEATRVYVDALARENKALADAEKAREEAERRAEKAAKDAKKRAEDTSEVEDAYDKLVEIAKARSEELLGITTTLYSDSEAARTQYYKTQMDAVLEATDFEEDQSVRMTEIYVQMANDAQLSAEEQAAARKWLADQDRKYTALMVDNNKKANDKITSDAKKAADERFRNSQDAAKKLGDIITGSITDGIDKEKKGRTVILDIIKKYSGDRLKVLGDSVLQEIAAYNQEKAAHGKLAADKMLQDKGSMAAAFAAAFAPLGPFALPAAAAAIAAMTALVNKFATLIHFAEGGPVSGRVPGLGSQDTVPGQLASDEGVLTGAGMNTTLGQLLGSINKGFGNNGTALAAAGSAQQLDVRVSFDVPGGSDDSFVRWIMERINVRVVQRNAPLVASRYHSQNGRAI